MATATETNGRTRGVVSGVLRLNLGAGDHPIEGFVNLDRKSGAEVYPLPYPDESIDEIRASHVLEHFGHREVDDVLREWVRVLKPGGRLRVAVPDLRKVCELYLAGADVPIQGFLMGGQVDADDFHRCAFDRNALIDAMSSAGLTLIGGWVDDAGDCASMPISLNIEGHKPAKRRHSACALLSLPRVTWTDNVQGLLGAFERNGIPVSTFQGAFWGQCLERVIENNLDYDYVITVDYDSIFTPRNVFDLLLLAEMHPEFDAIAPFQTMRGGRDVLLANMLGDNGRPLREQAEVDADRVLARRIVPAASAHFGLTILRTQAIRDLPHPWFLGVPGADGRWGEDRTDDDVYFWKQWRKHGRTIGVSPRVSIGHLEAMVRWITRSGEVITQHVADWRENGPPEGVEA